MPTRSIQKLAMRTQVHDEFVSRLVERVRRITTGDGLEPGVTMGPIINPKQLARVHSIVQDSLAAGARAATGGDLLRLPGHLGSGNFFAPTVLTNATSDMRCTREEIFGPVAAVVPFKSEEEAVRQANDTPFGLAAYFYTTDLARQVAATHC